ncbi:Nucleoporin Ndc1 [Sergentomyia squamirostris]
MIAPQELESRKICVERFILAIVCSTISQFFMLALFLLFVNINVFHPITWIKSLSTIFSIYTWLCIIPLIGSVCIYGVFMARLLITGPQFYRNRFAMYRSSGKRVIYMGVHGIVGFLTAWLYAKFLPDGYNSLRAANDCREGQWCYNEKYIFIILSGFYTGIYFFTKEYIKSQNLVTFPIIRQRKYVQITSGLSGIFCKSMTMTVFSTGTYIVGYWIVSGMLKWILLEIFSLTTREESLFGHLMTFILDYKLLIFEWILTSQILSNMYLINRLFMVFLTEHRTFPIIRVMGVESEITLGEALAIHQVPVIQDLACQDLFMVANGCDPSRRKDIFTLSIPGGHPHNWKAIITQCLELVNNFNQKLTKSIEGLQLEPIVPTKAAFVKPTATEIADKIHQVQQFEGFRIHRSTNPQDFPSNYDPKVSSSTFYTLQDLRRIITNYTTSLKKSLLNYPGIHFLFSEKPFEEMFFHLRHSQRVLWIVQAVAALAEKSIEEDKFGVVQNDLKDIIRTFLRLKISLDKIGNVMLGERKVDRNYLALKCAIRRSLYRISNTFAPYFGDLMLSEADLKALTPFITYKEA